MTVSRPVLPLIALAAARELAAEDPTFTGEADTIAASQPGKRTSTPAGP